MSAVAIGDKKYNPVESIGIGEGVKAQTDRMLVALPCHAAWSCATVPGLGKLEEPKMVVPKSLGT